MNILIRNTRYLSLILSFFPSSGGGRQQINMGGGNIDEEKVSQKGGELEMLYHY